MTQSPDNDAIIARFLSYRLGRFVRQVQRETLAYMQSPSMRGRPGYLKRDRVAGKLTNRAYRRYARTIPTTTDNVPSRTHSASH